MLTESQEKNKMEDWVVAMPVIALRRCVFLHEPLASPGPIRPLRRIGAKKNHCDDDKSLQPPSKSARGTHV